MRTILVCLAAMTALLSAEAQAQRRPVKVFLLVGQSNMEGKGAVRHLETLIKDAKTRETFKHLKKGRKWVERKDVWIAYDRNNSGRQVGRLTVGYGSKKDQIGPELGFGHVVGDNVKEQVLLIKCCWGGASIKKDFLPPGSGGPGPYYQKMLNEISLVVSDLKSHFPAYRRQGFEIAGLVWFQGWNDSVGGGNPEYTEQLAQFIRDVRKEFETPDLPVVIGELGQAGAETSNEGALKFRKQQRAVAELEEFKGTVSFIKTSTFVDPRLHELFGIWRKCKDKENEAKKQKDETATKAAWSEWEAVKDEYEASASDRPYHYFGSGRIFYLIGDALGRAMVDLIAAAPAKKSGGKRWEPRRPKRGRKADGRSERAPAGSAVASKPEQEHVAKRKELQPKIDIAIESGVEWLLSKQQPDGSWGGHQGGYRTGQTALSIYTLLKCGLSPGNADVRRGLTFLEKNFPTQTYSLGCQLMAFEATGDRKYKKRIARMVEELVEIQCPDGGWGYPRDRSDLSNTQYAALGLRAGAMAGVRVKPKVLHDLEAYVLSLQEDPRKMKLPLATGDDVDRYKRTRVAKVAGFPYLLSSQEGKCTGSMTVAGIGVLAIVRDCRGKRGSGRMGKRSRIAIDRAINWLQVNWSVTKNPNKGDRFLYYLYGLERVGGLLMKEIIAGHPWYVEGAQVLLKRQGKDGSWESRSEHQSCFALLFLRRATWHGGGVTGASRGRGGHVSTGGDVHVGGSGDRSLSIWVKGFSPKVLDRWKMSRDETDMRIVKVEYLVGGKVVALVDGDVSRPWRGESLAGLHKFERNGTYEITAQVHALPPGAKNHHADTKLEVLKSSPIVVVVRSVIDPMRKEISKAVSQDLLRDVKITCEVSSRKKEAPGHAARFVADGRLGTHWISSKEDQKPTADIKLRDRITARYVIVVPAPANANCAEIESLELVVNGSIRREARPDVPRRAVLFDLKKRRGIESLRIRIRKKKPGKDSHVGLAEVYLYR